MATPSAQMPAADGSDTINIQADNAPANASQTLNVRGYAIDQGGYIAGLKVANTIVGEFSGLH